MFSQGDCNAQMRCTLLVWLCNMPCPSGFVAPYGNGRMNVACAGSDEDFQGGVYYLQLSDLEQHITHRRRDRHSVKVQKFRFRRSRHKGDGPAVLTASTARHMGGEDMA